MRRAAVAASAADGGEPELPWSSREVDPMAMEKRARFRSRWLPYALIVPQIAITLVFFFWPAGAGAVPVAAGPGRVRRQHAVRLVRQFPRSLPRRALSRVVPGDGGVLAAGRRARARRSRWCWRCSPTASCAAPTVYKTLLIWPYAVAPAIAAVLWLFLFNPTLGVVAYWLKRARRRLELPAQRQPGAARHRDRRGVEADQLQLPVLPRRAAVDPEIADRGGGDRRRGTGEALRRRSSFRCCRRRRSSCSSSTSSTRSSTRSAIVDAATSGGPGQATEILVYKVYKDGFKGLDLGGSAAQSVVLMAIVITLTVVQFRFVERKVQY